jgi:hypothetical protein
MYPKSSLPHSKHPATCAYPEPHQFSPCPYPTTWLSILTLYSHLRFVLPSSSFPQVSPPKPCLPNVPHTLPIFFVRCPPLYNIWWAVQIVKILVMCCSPLHCYLFLLLPKYLPRHLILQHSQPKFHRQCERPSFTPVQNNRQTYTSVRIYLGTELED